MKLEDLSVSKAALASKPWRNSKKLNYLYDHIMGYCDIVDKELIGTPDILPLYELNFTCYDPSRDNISNIVRLAQESISQHFPLPLSLQTTYSCPNASNSEQPEEIWTIEGKRKSLLGYIRGYRPIANFVSGPSVFKPGQMYFIGNFHISEKTVISSFLETLLKEEKVDLSAKAEQEYCTIISLL